MFNARLFFLVLIPYLVFAEKAQAHGLGIECTLDAKTNCVVVSAYYTDDTPAAKAKVRIVDLETRLVAQGETDAQGMWAFPRPEAGVYRVEVDAGGGHRKRIHLTVPESAGQAIASDDPTRAEFTRFPWGGLAAGLSSIGLLTFLSRRFLRKKGERGT